MKRRTFGGAATAAALWAVCASVAAQPAASGLLGTWRLLSFQAVADGEAPIDPWGKEPIGYAVITPKRFITVVTASDRKLPAGPTPTPQELVASFVSQNGYTGTYRVDGNRLITTVDAAAYATWYRTEQVREFKLEGNRLHLSTLHGPLPVAPGKRGRMHLVWEKID
jgi:hypothetical protein